MTYGQVMTQKNTNMEVPQGGKLKEYKSDVDTRASGHFWEQSRRKPGMVWQC